MTRVRASDAEREEVARLLQSAAGEGRLSPEEAGDRLARVSAVTYQDELETLTDDLPHAAVDRPALERRGPVSPWLAWRLLRVGVFAAMVFGLWTFAGVRFWMMWPLTFMAFGLLMGARRRRRWRWGGPWGYYGGPWGHPGRWDRRR